MYSLCNVSTSLGIHAALPQQSCPAHTQHSYAGSLREEHASMHTSNLRQRRTHSAWQSKARCLRARLCSDSALESKCALRFRVPVGRACAATARWGTGAKHNRQLRFWVSSGRDCAVTARCGTCAEHCRYYGIGCFGGAPVRRQRGGEQAHGARQRVHGRADAARARHGPPPGSPPRRPPRRHRRRRPPRRGVAGDARGPVQQRRLQCMIGTLSWGYDWQRWFKHSPRSRPAAPPAPNVWHIFLGL